MRKLLYLGFLVSGLVFASQSNSQGLLKKIKDKVNQAVDKKVDNEIDKKTGTTSDPSQGGNTGGNSDSPGKPTNKGGGGLTNTEPPDVNKQMLEAEDAHKQKKYSDARFSIQQALMGVEIQLGRMVLKSLPDSVLALPKDSLQDKVMSTQWGWNNLSIQRVYRKGDKQLTFTVGNNTIYSGFIALYFSNATMVQANDQSQNFKQIRVKGNKAIITYDDAKGYTIMMQMGQASLMVWECINFANEQEAMQAPEPFDIDFIKKSFGEQ